MGRAERRRAERMERLERKNQVTMTRAELSEMKRQDRMETSAYDVEILMSCFALALLRLDGMKCKRIMKHLNYIDELMRDTLEGRAQMSDYLKELEDEADVIIKCK